VQASRPSCGPSGVGGFRKRLLTLAALILSCGCGRSLSVVSISPDIGTGTQQTFTLVYSAPAGFSDLTNIGVLIATSTDAIDTCYVWYDPIHDALKLADDDAVNWIETSRRGQGSLENSQCRVTAAGSSMSGDGTKLTLRIPVTFKRAFAGRKIVYLYAEERQGLKTGFVRKGRWAVPY